MHRAQTPFPRNLTRYATTLKVTATNAWLWYPGPWLNRSNRIPISTTTCNLFSWSSSEKNFEVKRAWSGAIWRWVTTWKWLPGAHKWGQSAQKRLVLVCGGQSRGSRELPGVTCPSPKWSGCYISHQDPRDYTGVCGSGARTCGPSWHMC